MRSSRNSVSAHACTCSNAAANRLASTGRPATWMRSVGSARCGDVNSPVRYPAARSPDSIIAQVEPLPLVPATCTIRQACCGLPSDSSRTPIRSSPSLAVLTSLPSAYKNRTESG